MATGAYRLENTIQHYDWGSPTHVHALLGTEPDGRPAAELWLGAHPSAPSIASSLTDGAAGGLRLDALVRSAPEETLGRRVSEDFGPRLPYLLKVLAAEQALSLQVHPRPHAARAGFNRENREGVPLDSPARSFHDDQHKPEMIVALTRFHALAGFRAPRAALSLLDGLRGNLVDRVRDALSQDRTARGIRAAFGTLVEVRQSPTCREQLAEAVASVRARLGAGSRHALEDATVLRLAEQFPGDPGAIASLLLNRVVLEPGQAMFTPAGEVHAYLEGLGVEVMASSDNVLRAGLTHKHVDERALVECASFEPRPATAPLVRRSGALSRTTTYRVPVREFALTLADVDAAEPVTLPEAGPRIVLALDGELELHQADGTSSLRSGASLFLPHASGAAQLAGAGRVVCAWVP